MSILIKNAAIVTMEQELGIIEPGYLLVEGNRISRVGGMDEFDDTIKVEKVIDGSDFIVMPGLINLHTHVPMTLLRSYADDLPLEKWLYDHIFPVEAKLKPDYIYMGSLLGIAEMIMSGTTTFVDMYFYEDMVAKAVEETGVRAVLSQGIMGEGRKDWLKLKAGIKFYENWNDRADGRIKVYLGPHAVYTCTPKFLKLVLKESEKERIPVHIHVSETQTEVSNCIEEYGVSPVKHLDNLGIFERDTVAAHCVHLDDEDMEIIKKNNVSIAYNPTSNLKLASGFAPVSKYLRKGINVGLGTDGASSNNNLNMFEELHLSSIVNKAVESDATAVPAFESLRCATVNGAKALGYEGELGVIKEGALADIIIIDRNKPHMYPRTDIHSQLVYSVQASDVDTVIVNGRIVMESRKLKTIEIEEVEREVEKIFNELVSK